MTVVLLVGSLLQGTPALAATERAATDSASAAIVQAADLSNFQPGNIISNAVFFDKSSMNESQIQSFLQSKVTSCQSGYTCLKDWYDTSRTTSADAMCGAYSGGERERASRIIYKVAQACGINPRVIIVMLQKEQGLVTHTSPTSSRYRIAMGQGCPDTAACDTRYYGFFNQIHGAAWQLKRYANPPGTSQFFTWYAPGKTWNILWHPNHACGSKAVTVQNQATANLYYYTPYQPNAAAIRAGYGTGDGCSSYGNRNFYNYFTDWFGSTQATPCTVPAGSTTATWTYTAVIATTARTAPSTGCKSGAVSLPVGTIGKAVAASADGEWRKIRTESGERWVALDHLRPSTSAEAACGASTTTEASWAFTVVADVTGRAAPTAECGLGLQAFTSGAVVRATAASADGAWRKVTGESGDVWVPLDKLRHATSAEADCVQALASSASWTYTTTAATTGRMTPSTACAQGTVALPSGTVATAVAASADGAWRKLRTAAGDRWVPMTVLRQASATEIACAPPLDASPASWTYVITAATMGRSAPNAACENGASALAAGTIAKAVATSADGTWRKLQTESGAFWIALAELREATASEAGCAAPAGVGAASWTYVAVSDATGRIAPAEACGIDSTTVTAGTVVPAVATSKDGLWRKLRTSSGDRWVLAAQLRKATSGELACVPPTKVVGASWTFVTLVATTARTAPNSLCATGAVSLPIGTIAKSIAASVDGRWRLLQTTSGDRWVPLVDIHHVRMTTTAAVNLRAEASGTATVITTLPKGTAVVVIGSSGVWRKVTVGTRTGWIRHDYLG